ncbi:MAG TPA: hypothetical protein VG253_00525 [Streptosporangiaceae bacterium]|nr:hypothetical protein [Streptosporangiaceae bacterium]
MALQFIGKDPESDTNNCPAVFIDEETGDFLLQGWTVTNPATLAESSTRSPLADNESLIRVPARMRAIIMEALHGQGAAVQRPDRGDDTISGAPGAAGHLRS